MSDKNFEVKKGLNVRNGRFLADENEVSIDGIPITTQTELNAEEAARISADNTLQSNIDVEEASRISTDNTLQANIDVETERVDDLYDGTGRNIMVIDSNTFPYNGDYSTYANRLQIPLDVDEVHINTDVASQGVNIEILDNRTKDLFVRSIIGGGFDPNVEGIRVYLENDNWFDVITNYDIDNDTSFVHLAYNAWFNFQYLPYNYDNSLPTPYYYNYQTNMLAYVVDHDDIWAGGANVDDGERVSLLPESYYRGMFEGNSQYHQFGGLGISRSPLTVNQNDYTAVLSGNTTSPTFYRLDNSRGYTNAVFNCELTPATDDTFYAIGNVTISGNGNTIDGSADLYIGYQKVTEFKYNGDEWITTNIPFTVFLLGDYVGNDVGFNSIGVQSTKEDEIATITPTYQEISANDGTGWTSTGNISPTIPDGAPRDATLSPDGTHMYVVSDVTNQLHHYTLSTPFDVSTASFVYTGSSYTGTPYSVQVSPDGTKIYISDSSGNRVQQIGLVTPWDTSVVTGPVYSPTVQGGSSCRSMRIRNDGTKLYVSSQGSNFAYEYDLTTPWDVTTSVYTGNSLNLGAQVSPNIGNIEISNSGIHFYHIVNGSVWKYELSTPWDLSTAVYKGAFYTGFNHFGMFLSYDNQYVYYTDSFDDVVRQTTTVTYNLNSMLNLNTDTKIHGSLRIFDEFIAQPTVDNLSTAVAYKFATVNDLSTAGAKIASFQNGATEVMAIHDGGVDVTGLVKGDALEVSPNGLNFSDYWGTPSGGNIVSVVDASLGTNQTEFAMASVNGSAWASNYAYANIHVAAFDTGYTRAMFDLYAHDGTGSDSKIQHWIQDDVAGSGPSAYISFNIKGTTRCKLEPTVADGATAVAYKFGATNLLDTAGAKIASFSHDMAGTEKEVMSIHDGGVDVTGTLTVDTIDDSGAGYITIRGNRVLIGDSATSSAIESIAIGVSSSVAAGLDYGIAIGSLAQAGEQCISLGYNAGASGDIENFGARTIAIGYEAQKANLGLSNPGLDRIAIGTSSLAQGGHGNDIAIGRETLYGHVSNLANHRGNKFNVAIGYQAQAAMSYITPRTQDRCVAIGYQAMTDSTTTPYTGFSNIAIGDSAGQNLSTWYNISIGSSSNGDGAQAIAIGRSASATATNATAIGYGASSTNANSVAIGLNATTSADNTMFVGGTTPMNLVVSGDMTVQGTTTTINTQDLLVEDHNIIIGNVALPTDLTADGGGITLLGSTNKTITWTNSTDSWNFNQSINIAEDAAVSRQIECRTEVSGSGLYAESGLYTSSVGTGQAAFECKVEDGSTYEARIAMFCDSSGPDFFMRNDYGFGEIMYMRPQSATTAYYFNATTDMTASGLIAYFSHNDGDEVMRVDANGIEVTGQITGAEPWTIHTTTAANEGITGAVNVKYMVDTTASTGNITLTMPDTTSIPVGTTVTVNDMKGNFAVGGSKNVVTDDALELFNGVAGTWEFDVANSTTQLVWTGPTYGWKVIVIAP